uniref:AH domain-containing protein n=1 Tax=Timema genevievae TaxID=629358 RepID=A0A7R9JWR1_TIMGE|nr:unnamed protein product [Timema genevievae]
MHGFGRLILRCRQDARARFARLRSDVLVKIELLDNKHVQDIVWQLQRFVSGLVEFHRETYQLLKGNSLFPIEVDLSRSAFQYKSTSPVVQLAVDDSKSECPGVKKLLQKAKNIVGHYRRSSQARERLHSLQERMQVPQLELIQYVETRWSSEYCMLQRLVEMKGPIAAELAQSEHNIEPLTNADWAQAKGVLEVLEPLAQATKEISGDSYPTSSMVIPILHCLSSHLNSRIQRQEEANLSTALRNELYRDFEEMDSTADEPEPSTSNSGLWSFFDSLPNERKEMNISEEVEKKGGGGELREGRDRSERPRDRTEEKKKMASSQVRKGDKEKKKDRKEEEKIAQEESRSLVTLKKLKEAEEFVRSRYNKDGWIKPADLIIDKMAELIFTAPQQEGKINKLKEENNRLRFSRGDIKSDRTENKTKRSLYKSVRNLKRAAMHREKLLYDQGDDGTEEEDDDILQADEVTEHEEGSLIPGLTH